MTKTLKLEGSALQVVREMVANQELVEKQLQAIKEQAEAVIVSTYKKEEAQMALLRQCLGLTENDSCEVDVEYLKEHGLAFVRIGCRRPYGLAETLARLFGGNPNGGLH